MLTYMEQVFVGSWWLFLACLGVIGQLEEYIYGCLLHL